MDKITSLDASRFDLRSGHTVPLSVFSYGLSALETITKYAKEVLEMSFSEIASALNRDDRTIWGSYQSAKGKMSEVFPVEGRGRNIPLYVLSDRKLSILESVVEYLKEQGGLRYCQIATLLHRDDRTVWTVYQRAQRKRRKSYVGMAQ